MEIAVSGEKRGGGDVIQRQISKVQREAQHGQQQVDGGSPQFYVRDHLVSFEAGRRVRQDEFQSRQEVGNQNEDPVLQRREKGKWGVCIARFSNRFPQQALYPVQLALPSIFSFSYITSVKLVSINALTISFAYCSYRQIIFFPSCSLRSNDRFYANEIKVELLVRYMVSMTYGLIIFRIVSLYLPCYTACGSTKYKYSYHK